MELKVVDIAAISGLLSSIKASRDISKAMLDIRDGQIGREQVIELTGQLVTAYDKALDAREAQTKLHERIDELKNKLVKFENWDAEKSRYQLAEINTGVFAYIVKPGMEAGEPAHKICARCYEDRRRSILQTVHRRHGSNMLTILSCQTCNAEIVEASKAIAAQPTRSRPTSWRL